MKAAGFRTWARGSYVALVMIIVYFILEVKVVPRPLKIASLANKMSFRKGREALFCFSRYFKGLSFKI